MEYQELLDLGKEFADRINSNYIRLAMRDFVKEHNLNAIEAWALHGIIDSHLRLDLTAGVAQARPEGMY
jgi:hypothetical protein